MNTNNLISNYIIDNELDMEKIISEYSNYLLKVISNICGNYLSSEDIEELILDVFMALWKNKSKLDTNKKIKPYIASIAHNLTKKKMTANGKNQNIIDLDDDALLNIKANDINSSIDSKLQMEELDEILNSLSNEDYMIFTLFYYNSYKTKQIAKKLGISNVKVKTKLHRIRLNLRKKLKERGYSIWVN